MKVFGGGKIISSMSSVGLNNIKFIHEYIRIEGLQLLSEDVGDCYPRKIVFYPASGRVQVKKIKQLHKMTLCCGVSRRTRKVSIISLLSVKLNCFNCL